MIARQELASAPAAARPPAAFAHARHGRGEIGFGDGRVGDCSARELIDDAAAGEDQHAIAETFELDAVGGGDQHRHALIGKRAQALVDFAARADVDALGRLVDQEHRRLRRDLASEQRLLLIAAGQFEQLRFDRCGADAQVLGDLPGALDLLGRDRSRRSAKSTSKKPSPKFSRSVKLRNTPSAWRSSGTKPMPARRKAPGLSPEDVRIA